MKARIIGVIFKAFAIALIAASLWGIGDIRFWICIVAFAISTGLDGSLDI